MELREKEYKGFNCLALVPQVALYPGLLVQLTGKPAQDYVVLNITESACRKHSPTQLL
jgi:hypothetical protein